MKRPKDLIEGALPELEYDQVLKVILEAQKDGFINALRAYAWWRDGVQYVGTCGRTLKDAIKQVETDFKKYE